MKLVSSHPVAQKDVRRTPGGPGRSRGRAPIARPRLQRGHLQPPHLRGAGKPTLSADPVRLHWSEITASSLLEVGYDGKVLQGEGEAELSGFCIHAPIHRLIPAAVCVMHTHMPFASALARLEDPTIKPIGQTECGLMRHVVYDELYTGPAFDPAEGERIARVLGDGKVMFMANHGVLTVGGSVAEAYDLLYYLERVAQVQLYAMWTGQKLKTLPPPVVAETMRTIVGPTYGGKPHLEHHFDALKRMLTGASRTTGTTAGAGQASNRAAACRACRSP
jgi:ribulose-5-phosphate 4-epimerase/fuculose-1-phosphate aldolase